MSEKKRGRPPKIMGDATLIKGEQVWEGTESVETKESPKETSLITVNPEALIARAIDKNLPLESMERLLAMRRELKVEWAKEQFFRALSGFQKECPIIKKSAKVDFTSKRTGNRTQYVYAPLDEIVSQVKDILEKWGFSYTIKPEQTKDEVKSICYAHHVDGHTEETPFAVPIDHEAFMNDAQKVASAMTYSKRYAFCNAFGIMTGDQDDDAQHISNDIDYGAAPKTTPKPAAPPLPEMPKMDRPTLLAQLKIIVESGAFSSDEITAARETARTADSAGLERLRLSMLKMMESRADKLNAIADKAFDPVKIEIERQNELKELDKMKAKTVEKVGTGPDGELIF